MVTKIMYFLDFTPYFSNYTAKLYNEKIIQLFHMKFQISAILCIKSYV